LSGIVEDAGLGKRACPASTAVTRKRPTLQHGHTSTSVLATRAMKALADSIAWGLLAGICKASLAAPSFCALQQGANTP
jgi:hypothetical protein